MLINVIGSCLAAAGLGLADGHYEAESGGGLGDGFLVNTPS